MGTTCYILYIYIYIKGRGANYHSTMNLDRRTYSITIRYAIIHKLRYVTIAGGHIALHRYVTLLYSIGVTVIIRITAIIMT